MEDISHMQERDIQYTIDIEIQERKDTKRHNIEHIQSELRMQKLVANNTETETLRQTRGKKSKKKVEGT